MYLYTEDSVRGTKLFVYYDENQLLLGKNYNMFRIALITSGSGIIELNDEKYVYNSPIVICLNNKDIIKFKNNTETKSREIFFIPEVINSILTFEKIYKSSESIMRKTISPSEFRDYYYLLPFLDKKRKIFDIELYTLNNLQEKMDYFSKEIAHCKHHFWRCRARSYIIEILSLVQFLYFESEENPNLKTSNNREIIDEIILYIHNYYNEKLTIGFLTEKFHINRTTLNNKFKNATGKSIMDYIIQIRLKVASTMLKDTGLSVSEIMYRVGINDQSYFSRLFSKKYGITPSKFRKIKQVL